MTNVDRIRTEIAQIAQRRKNTTAAEIKWVVDQLAINGYAVKSRKLSDGVLYTVESVRFSGCTHNRGNKQIKACYVDDFLQRMIEIGLYDE
jgi:hypothetical protein